MRRAGLAQGLGQGPVRRQTTAGLAGEVEGLEDRRAALADQVVETWHLEPTVQGVVLGPEQIGTDLWRVDRLGDRASGQGVVEDIAKSAISGVVAEGE